MDGKVFQAAKKVLEDLKKLPPDVLMKKLEEQEEADFGYAYRTAKEIDQDNGA